MSTAVSVGIIAFCAPITATAFASSEPPLDLLTQANIRIDGGTWGVGSQIGGGQDINGDEVPDFLMASGQGDVQGVFGSSSNRQVSLSHLGDAGFTISSTGVDGAHVALVGDVNGDAVNDIAYAQPEDAGCPYGAVYVLFGGSLPSNLNPGWTPFDGFKVCSAPYPSPTAGLFGVAVAGAGDVNGDGLADVVIGDPDRHAGGKTFAGAVFVVFGKQSTSPLYASDLGDNGFEIDGDQERAFAGVAVAGGHDINGDGRADVVLGQGGLQKSAYVVFGKASPNTVSLGSLGGAGFRIKAPSGSAAFGSSVASTGDINGDGYGDLLVGSENGDLGREASGVSYGVFGDSASADVDAQALGTRGFEIVGAAAGDYAGVSVAGAGDVNGDGTPDLMIGAPWATRRGRAQAGAVYVIDGGALTGTVDLADPSNYDAEIDGARPGDITGYGLASAGDVNRDGRDDLFIGAPGARGECRGTPGDGEAYVLFSGAPDSRHVECDTVAPTTRILLHPPTPDGQDGWYRSTPYASVSAVDAAPVSEPIETRCELDPVTATSSFGSLPSSCPYLGDGEAVVADGEHTIYAASKDGADNEETPTSLSFKLDATAPTVTCEPATLLLHASSGSVSASVTDATSGPRSALVSAPVDTDSVGEKSVRLEGGDNAGNAAEASCPYVVGYDFPGFLSPVNDRPVVNTGQAGRTYPIRWTLTDANGHYVTSLSAVSDGVYKPTACSAFTDDPTDALETSTTGRTGFSVNPRTGEFVYKWATPGRGCYTLFLKLDSTQVIPAYFQFL